MSKNLLILGAGVDRTSGIDFPLASTLLADVARYLAGPGKEVDVALRDMLPGVRFSFSTMIARAVDKAATRDLHEQRAMVERVQAVIRELAHDKAYVRRHGELIVRLFNKLATIAKESQLDSDTESLIREVFPSDADDLIDSDSILDIHKLSLSDTFKAVLKRTLKLGLGSDGHEVATALSADMLNIETLLVEKFLGFYNDKPSDIKNYLYIAWALWAYLVTRQQDVFQAHAGKAMPFYGELPDDIHAITLNYTAFLEQRLGPERTLNFHGGLGEYVRMDTRDVLRIDDVLACDPAKFLREVVKPNVDVVTHDLRKQRHVIPAFVPPLRLKPILSQRYIELWSRAADWVKHADHVVVVGYSFNNADEHFNDILRRQTVRQIDIVVPEATKAEFLFRMEQVFHMAASNDNHIRINGLPAVQAGKVRLIQALAGETNVSQLFDS